MTVLGDLRSLFVDWRAALEDFLSRPPVTARSFFASAHVWLWLQIPVFCLISPLPWFSAGRFSVTSRILLPAAVPLFFFLFALVYDRLLAYERPPAIDAVRPMNAMLFCALTGFAGGVFHLLHPLAGIAASLLFGAYAVLLCLRAAIAVYNLTPAQALFRAAGALTIVLIPAAFAAFLVHIGMTFRVLGQILS